MCDEYNSNFGQRSDIKDYETTDHQNASPISYISGHASHNSHRTSQDEESIASAVLVNADSIHDSIKSRASSASLTNNTERKKIINLSNKLKVL